MHDKMLHLAEIYISALETCYEHYEAIELSAHQHSGHHSWFSVQNEVVQLTDMRFNPTPLRFAAWVFR